MLSSSPLSQRNNTIPPESDSHAHESLHSSFSPVGSRTAVYRWRKLSSLLLASGSFTVIVGLLYTFLTFSDLISTGVALFWCVFALALPCVSCVHYSRLFLSDEAHSDDSNAALVCSAEVCINNETVLTVRSWWSVNMSSEEVERHGVRVAMTSARRWISDNSHPGGKITRVKFTEEVASELCTAYLCEHSLKRDHEYGPCSVCLDDLELGQSCVRMKKCGHAFHKECLASWISQSSRLTCLLCRADHCDLVPQGVLTQHIVKEEPSISVLTVNIERGVLAVQ